MPELDAVNYLHTHSAETAALVMILLTPGRPGCIVGQPFLCSVRAYMLTSRRFRLSSRLIGSQRNATGDWHAIRTPCILGEHAYCCTALDCNAGLANPIWWDCTPRSPAGLLFGRSSLRGEPPGASVACPLVRQICLTFCKDMFGVTNV